MVTISIESLPEIPDEEPVQIGEYLLASSPQLGAVCCIKEANIFVAENCSIQGETRTNIGISYQPKVCLSTDAYPSSVFLGVGASIVFEGAFFWKSTSRIDQKETFWTELQQITWDYLVSGFSTVLDCTTADLVFTLVLACRVGEGEALDTS